MSWLPKRCPSRPTAKNASDLQTEWFSVWNSAAKAPSGPSPYPRAMIPICSTL